MLVVNDVMREGPADGSLLPGDILVAIDGAPVIGFSCMSYALPLVIAAARRIKALAPEK